MGGLFGVVDALLAHLGPFEGVLFDPVRTMTGAKFKFRMASKKTEYAVANKNPKGPKCSKGSSKTSARSPEWSHNMF